MKLTFDGTVTIVNESKLDHIISLLNIIRRKETEIMSKLDERLTEIITATESQKTVLDSLVIFVAGLQEQIASGVTGLSAEQEAQLEAVFTAINANTKEAADAMIANTPSA